MMRTVVSIHLFPKPSWEMDIEGIDYIDPEILKRALSCARACTPRRKS